MTIFTDELQALIDEQFTNTNHFCQVSGAGAPHLSEILRGRRIPSPATLRKWLENAAISEKAIDRLVFLCRYDRMRDNKDLHPLLDYFERQINDLRTVLFQTVAVYQRSGVELPDSLAKIIQRIKAGE